MHSVIEFKPFPLSPFVGEWILDPLSVSRNKVVKRTLGEDGFRKLWACGSMEERAQCLATEPELAERYRSVLHVGRESNLVITLQNITWIHLQSATLPAKTTVYPVVRVVSEGRKVLVHSIDIPERGRQSIIYVLRMNKRWLLFSQQFTGRQAQLFPRSPVFRYYASNGCR